MASSSTSTIAVLASGGLDSSILVAHLLRRGQTVQPLYVRSNLAWQDPEERGLRRFLAAVQAPLLLPLVTLELPLADLYEDHWSIHGRDVPAADSPDEAMFLPGRNALLLIKPAIWCQLKGIRQLALAPLGTSPFADATPDFFASLQSVVNHSGIARVRILSPFRSKSKARVMQLGRHVPLELTFSCVSPIRGLHCGTCNKCAERRGAFRDVGRVDLTPYALTRESAASRP